jgi:hypothetical protein
LQRCGWTPVNTRGKKYEHGRNRSLFEICEALDVSLASMFERNLK